MKGNLQELFQLNLKYISQLEINAEDIDRQFVKSQTRYCLRVGEIDCLTGKVIVSDPLCYLAAGKLCPELAITIPIGTYPVDISICRNPDIGIRMCTARLKITNAKAIKYDRAEPTIESAVARGADGVLTGFPVEAGMMSFCDVKVAEEYQCFLEEWYKENEGKNHYDDYFARYFAESEKKLPAYQREGGDFIEWTNPISKHKLVMIASGFGDGFYQCYWGYDMENSICELIVPMINPDLFE